MLFEAQLKESKYTVSVDHKYPFWEISIQKEDSEAKIYQIPEQDFQEVDDVVSFLFKNESYLVDVLSEGTEYNGMPGKIVKVLVENGQSVKAGDSLLVMEAMKMENEMKASADCTVKEIKVKAGDSVESGALLIDFELS